MWQIWFDGIVYSFCNSASVDVSLMPDIANTLAVSETVSPVACISAPAGRCLWTLPRLDQCTSTFSTSAALARILQERNAGIDDTADELKLFKHIHALRRGHLTHRSRCKVTRNPVDVGLNSIISIKRSRSLSANSSKSDRKQPHDYGIMQRRYSPPNTNYRDMLTLLEDIRKNLVLEKKRSSAEMFEDDILMHCNVFNGDDASRNDRTDIVSDVKEGVSCSVTVPQIMINSEPALPTSNGSPSFLWPIYTFQFQNQWALTQNPVYSHWRVLHLICVLAGWASCAGLKWIKWLSDMFFMCSLFHF